ncbi:molecular chaperone [Pseudoalteromonas xiamenensis]|uniref:fimbrial biogenesis chaperone n=1 Tax=Pseudoalteromonas xiamenensis TaxID=882626 RepID=UPI0035E6E998
MFLRRTFAFFLLLVSSFPSFANLSISPNRVVFSERDRVATIMLLNSGDQAVSYRLQWKNLVFDHLGNLINVDKPQGPLVENMIRVSPRHVTLAPNERQIVKLAIRKPKDLPEAEFRSYLNLVAQLIEAPKEQKQSGLHINLMISYNVPVIVRNSSRIPEVSIDKFTLPDSENIELVMSRRGPLSSSGNMTVEHVDTNGSKTVVARLNNANIYAEQSTSLFRLPLIGHTKLPKHGKLVIRYEGNEQFKNHLFAERSFTL